MSLLKMKINIVTDYVITTLSSLQPTKYRILSFFPTAGYFAVTTKSEVEATHFHSLEEKKNFPFVFCITMMPF
jgi:hypothetical protein